MKASAIVAAIGVGVLATALAAQPAGLPQGWMQTGDAQTCEDKVVPAIGAPSARVFNLDCKPGTKGFTSLMPMLMEGVAGDFLAMGGGSGLRRNAASLTDSACRAALPGHPPHCGGMR